MYACISYDVLVWGQLQGGGYGFGYGLEKPIHPKLLPAQPITVHLSFLQISKTPKLTSSSPSLLLLLLLHNPTVANSPVPVTLYLKKTIRQSNPSKQAIKKGKKWVSVDEQKKRKENNTYKS